MEPRAGIPERTGDVPVREAVGRESGDQYGADSGSAWSARRSASSSSVRVGWSSRMATSQAAGRSSSGRRSKRSAAGRGAWRISSATATFHVHRSLRTALPTGGRPRVGPRSTLPEVSGAQARQGLRMRSARLVPAGHRSGGAPTGEFRPARDRGRERLRCPGRPSPAGCATGRGRRRRRERRRPTSPRRAAGTAPGRDGRRPAAGCD